MKLGDLAARYHEGTEGGEVAISKGMLLPGAANVTTFARHVAFAALRRYPAEVCWATLRDTDWGGLQAMLLALSYEATRRLGGGVWSLCFPRQDGFVYALDLSCRDGALARDLLERLENERGIVPDASGLLTMRDTWGKRVFDPRRDYLVADFKARKGRGRGGGPGGDKTPPGRRSEHASWISTLARASRTALAGDADLKPTNQVVVDPETKERRRSVDLTNKELESGGFFRLTRLMPRATFERTWRVLGPQQLQQLGVPAPRATGLGPEASGPVRELDLPVPRADPEPPGEPEPTQSRAARG